VKRSSFIATSAVTAIVFPNVIRAAEPTNVTIGVVNSTTDVTLFIAEAKGFFKRDGLNTTFQRFVSGTAMTSSLGGGQLDVAGAAPVAGLYNAAARGIDVKMVADKGSCPRGYGFQPLLVRTELVKSGRFKSVKDLKGLTVAGNASGSTSASMLNQCLRYGGLAYDDVKHVYIGFPEMVLAFKSGAIDAALVTEPNASEAVNDGFAVKIMGNDTFYPNQQVAVLQYGSGFLKNKDAGTRFMRAYIHAARYYNDSLKGGKIAGSNAEDVIEILSQYGPVKDKKVLREITPGGINPDERLNVASLQTDFDFFKSQNQIEGSVKVADAIDESYIRAVLPQLGRYRRHA